MSISKKEIDELKKSHELKVHIFDLVKNKKNEEAINLLKKDLDAVSYFMKFKSADGRDQFILKILDGKYLINYDLYAENKISTDLNKIKKEIEEKEARYEQQEYLNQQKEFLELQKKDIIENKENREKTQQLTFVLAFGIIITSLFYLFQIFIEFKKSVTLHTLILSGLFLIVFLLLILFTFFIFNLDKELLEFFKFGKVPIIMGVSMILIFTVLIVIVPDSDLTNNSNNEVIFDSSLSQKNITPKTNDSTTNENLDNSEENIDKLNLSNVSI